MTPSQAKDSAIKKWQWIVDNDGKYGNILEVLTELNDLEYECSYCDLYRTFELTCQYCPLSSYQRLGCKLKTHPYSIWRIDQTKENAQAMLNLILNSK